MKFGLIYYYHALHVIQLFLIQFQPISRIQAPQRDRKRILIVPCGTVSGHCGRCELAVVEGGMSVAIGAVRSPQYAQRPQQPD